MPDPTSDKIIRSISQAAELYHRLVMLVAPAGAGKTSPRSRMFMSARQLLQGLSRNKTVVAAWSGSIDGKQMIFATPCSRAAHRPPRRR